MEFISESDLATFEGWLRYQAIDPSTTTQEDLAMWRREFDEVRQRDARRPIGGLMNLRQVPGEYRYAVAVRDGADLWLTLWVRRSPKGEVFIFQPRGDRSWNPHASYHRNGTVHLKSRDRKMLAPEKRQPLTNAFRGTEHVGMYFGHGPKRVGAVCDPAAFSGVIELLPGVLGPRDGGIAVDLVEPGHEPTDLSPVEVVLQKIFPEVTPWLVIRLVQCPDPERNSGS